MLEIFTRLADWLTHSVFGLDPATQIAKSVHFFIEDISKIFVLLLMMIYVLAWLRASLNTEVVRDFLLKRHRLFGYIAGAVFGAITPFCSCSSIPLFLGFTSARIPIGVTMSFLITSPMINEVAIVILGSSLGLKFTIIYVTVGILAGIIGGFFFDLIGAEKMLHPAFAGLAKDGIGIQEVEHKKLSMRERHLFAKSELLTILSRIWKWIFFGVGMGAALHGFVPEDFIQQHLGSGQWWSVPAAVLFGIPLYANVSGIIPIAESLIAKGVPIGTTLAFMMSVVGASFPEFIMLKQVMRPRLLIIFFLLLLVLFTLTGWLFNIIL